jgi:formyltetrahydrofolate deformylase
MVRGANRRDWLYHDGHVSGNDTWCSKRPEFDAVNGRSTTQACRVLDSIRADRFLNCAAVTFDTTHPFVLAASCASRIGTTAAVTGFLACRHLYIMQMQQFDDTLAERFFVRITFCAVIGEPIDVAHLRAEFSQLAAAQQMEWAIHDCTEPPRVLIMVSTLDHCLEDLLYRQRIGELRIEVSAIVSNHADLKPIADHRGIAFHHLPITAHTKLAQERQLLELIKSSDTEFVILARYMQILSDETSHALRGRVINIHHSFLPGFKGAKPYHQAHARGVKVIGATAHFVSADLDEGPIIEQIVERVEHSYTPQMLTAAGRDSERRALATAVQLVVERRVFLNGDRTVVFK